MELHDDDEVTMERSTLSTGQTCAMPCAVNDLCGTGLEGYGFGGMVISVGRCNERFLLFTMYICTTPERASETGDSGIIIISNSDGGGGGGGDGCMVHGA